VGKSRQVHIEGHGGKRGLVVVVEGSRESGNGELTRPSNSIGYVA
jgi:hypothetical protein